MEIKRNGSQPSGKGPADWFTGTVRIDPLFQANAPARASAASVTSSRVLAPRGTHIPSVRPCLSQPAAAGRSARAVQSRKFGLAMWCGSRLGKSTGMARRRQRP